MGGNNLPHPNDIDLGILYMKYLENHKFIRSVNEGVISGISTIDNPINEYIRCFRKFLCFNKEDTTIA